MQRTISAMVGKGSVNHNSRKFKAENVDGERSHLNIDYYNEPIKKIYHELFDEALKRYNKKQTRADRRIHRFTTSTALIPAATKSADFAMPLLSTTTSFARS